MIDDKERREHAPVDDDPHSPITFEDDSPISLDIPKDPVCGVWKMILKNPHPV